MYINNFNIVDKVIAAHNYCYPEQHSQTLISVSFNQRLSKTYSAIWRVKKEIHS